MTETHYEMGEHLLQYRDLREAAIAAGAVVEAVRHALEQLGEGETVELEGRLGLLTPQGFCADVGEAFGPIVQMLESYPRWSNVSNWQESEDVFFVATINDRPQEIRSRISYQEGGLSVHNITKRRLGCADLVLRSTDPGCCALATERELTGAQLDARISACLETTIPLEVLPPAVRPTGIRLKRRKSFYLASLAVPNEAFRFDCTLTWHGATKREAEKNQAEGLTLRREVEVECLLPREYLQSCHGDCTYLSLSIILKLLDFASALNPHTSVAFTPAHA